MMLLLAQSSAPDASAASAILFYLLAILCAGSAVGVVASRNIVRTAVFLLFALVGVAGLYFLLAGALHTGTILPDPVVQNRVLLCK